MGIKAIYNDEFINEILGIKSFLTSTKEKCDDFDKGLPDTNQQIEFIEKCKNPIFERLDRHFFKIWRLTREFSEEEMQRHQHYYQDQLVSMFDVSPYNKRVYEKPLGYAGDYLMMIYLYEDGYEGDSTYAKLIHRYSMCVPAARANHNRKAFYKEQLRNISQGQVSARVTSVACGPAMEIVEFMSEDPRADRVLFTCIDFEKKALDYVKKKVASLEKRLGKKFNVNYINANIHNLLRYEQLESLIEDQDLIYSSGLIDYFTDKIAAKMIGVFFQKLRQGGKLVVGNVSAEDQHRAYTEILGGWAIKHRTEADMLRLTEKIRGGKIVKIKYEEETKMNIFMIIGKT